MKPNGSHPLWLAVAALVLLAAGFAVTTQAARSQNKTGGAGMMSVSTPHQAVAAIGAGGYSLVDGDGKPVTDKDFRGKYQLIYFGFTSCPDVCPLDLRKMADALKLTGAKADRIAPIFITVDPARDTPAVMKQYTGQFSAKLIGLTGTAAQVKAAEASYKVYAAKAQAASMTGYTMNHSAYIYLMGPDGRFIDVFDPQDKPAAIAARLKKLVS